MPVSSWNKNKGGAGKPRGRFGGYRNARAPSPEPAPATTVVWPPPRPVSPTVNRGKLEIEELKTPSGGGLVKRKAKLVAQKNKSPQVERKPYNPRKFVPKASPGTTQSPSSSPKRNANRTFVPKNGAFKGTSKPFEPKTKGSVDVGKIKSKAELIARFTPASQGGYQKPTPTSGTQERGRRHERGRRFSSDPEKVRSRVAALVRERSVSPSKREANGTPNTFVPLTPVGNQRRKLKAAPDPNIVREKVAARVRERSQSPSRRNSGYGINTYVPVTPSGPSVMQKKKVTLSAPQKRKSKVLSNWPPKARKDSDVQKPSSKSSDIDQKPKSQRRLAAETSAQVKRKSDTKTSSDGQSVETASQSTAQESEGGSFFPFSSDKPAEKKNKSLFNRFKFLGGKKKETKDAPAAEKESPEEAVPQKSAPGKTTSKSPKNKAPVVPGKGKKTLKNTTKVSEDSAISAPAAIQDDGDLDISPAEDGDKRVNYRVRYQGKTNLPLNELYGDAEDLSGENSKKKGPDVWMTPLLVEDDEDDERAWMLKRVWDDDDLDELEEGHEVEETDLMGALKSLLGVPDLDHSWRGEDSNESNLASIPRLSQSDRSSGTWLIRRVNDFNGEVDESTSSSDEDRFDHRQMEEQIKEITGKTEHIIGNSSDPRQDVDAANMQNQKGSERRGKKQRRGRKPGRGRPREARGSDMERDNTAVAQRRPLSEDPPRDRQIIGDGRVRVKSKAAQSSSQPRRGINSLSPQRMREGRVNREIQPQPTSTIDNPLADGAYHYNPDYHVKPKSKEPDGQRYDYKVKGKWSMPFEMMAASKGSKKKSRQDDTSDNTVNSESSEAGNPVKERIAENQGEALAAE